MMTTWKYEGRSAIILMTFMVQALFIINGDGADNSTVVASSSPSSNLAKSVPTSLLVPSSLRSVPTSSVAQSSSITQTQSTPVAQTDSLVFSKKPVTTTVTASSPQMSNATSTSSVSIIPVAQTDSLVFSKKPVTTTVTASSPQMSNATSTSSVSIIPVAQTDSLVFSKKPVTTTVTASSPQMSNATSTSSVSIIVTPSIQDYTTTAAVDISPSQTSVTTSFTSSVSINATSAPPRAIYIKMTFKMPWGRLCFLLPLFIEALSDDLIEMKDLEYERVNPGRIKLMNKNEKCENKTYYDDKAVLKFYISNSTGNLDTVDKEMTIKAFEILYYYWVNDRMILLDELFEGKVEKVELIGTDQDVYIEEYTEIQRIGIGIGVGLAVVALILLIYYCVTCCRNVKSVGHSTEEGQMTFTNTVAINEEATTDAEDSGSTDTPRSDLKKTDDPEEVVIHTQPVTKTQDEMPLLSTIKDFEDGQKLEQTESDEKPDADKAPLAKPEPDNVSEGEPIKPIDEPEPEPIKSPDEPEGKPENEHETVAGSEDAPPTNAPPVTETPPETGEDTVTSSVTIVITPESSPATIEFPVPEPAHEPAKEDDDVKPDFSQSDNIDVDPNQGAINMAFDDKDEATGEGDEEDEDEETKF